MSQPRILSRAILGLLVLILGTVSALHLPIAFLPVWNYPEIQVRLDLPQSYEVDEVTQRWVVKIESSIRRLGSVRDTAGFVDAQGFDTRVLLEADTDPEVKAARLESDLERLRPDLPEGSRLSVWPVGGGAGYSFILWLPTEALGGLSEARLLADEIESLPRVQSVWLAGERRRELRLRGHEGTGPAELSASIRSALGGRPVGETRGADGRFVGVRVAMPERPLDALPIRRQGAVLNLGSVADLELAFDEPAVLVRWEGREGHALLIRREYEASPLELDRSLRALFRERGMLDEARFLVDEAEPLRHMIERLLQGLAASSLLLLLAHGWLSGWRMGLAQATVPWLAIATSLEVCWLSGTGLDVTTLPPLVLAVGTAILFQVVRGQVIRGQTNHGRAPRDWSWLGSLAWVALVGASLPVVVALLAGSLAGSLASPIRIFALAAPAACLVTLLVPAASLGLLEGAAKPLRWVLRRPWPVLLGGITVAYGCYIGFGDALSPRTGSLYPASFDLSITVRFPSGTEMGPAAERLERIERRLAQSEEIRSFWSLVERGQARMGVTVEPEYRSAASLAGLAKRLEIRLASSRESIRIRHLAGMGGEEPMRFDVSIRDRAEQSEDRRYHRFILRSTELASLRRSAAELREALLGMRWRVTDELIDLDWSEPSPRYELIPLPGVPEVRVDEAAARLRERGRMGTAVTAVGRPPGDRRQLGMRISAADAPLRPDEPHDRRKLLGLQRQGASALAVSGLFEQREGLSSPGIKRQAGTFVLPISVRMSGLAMGQVEDAVYELGRVLRDVELPAGVDIEKPQPPTYWTRERFHMSSIVLALPFLWLAVAVCRLDSWALGAAAILPSVLGAAFTLPSIRASVGHVDEMTIMGLVMALGAALPLSLEVAQRSRAAAPGRLAAARGYRWLGRRLPLAAMAVLAWIALLAAPTLGLDADRYPWAPLLRAAAWAGAASVAVAMLWLPVLLRAVDQVRFRDPEAEKELAHPPVWASPGQVELGVRNLSKVYGNGFRALRGVSFDLQPGIVGLLGPNGAGKTTLLRALCGLLEPSRGVVLYRGVTVRPENLPRYRNLVGFLPQDFNAYEGFTAEAFLDYWAIQKGIRDPKERHREIEILIEQVGLSEAANRKVRDFSGGMRRRIGIARSLIGAPEILIVDEPTTGLDVESRNRLRETLLRAAGERIIIFSTHIASDVAAAASRILLLAEGRLLFDGLATSLVDDAEGRVFEALVADEELREFSARYRVTTRVRTLEGIRVRAVAAPGIEPGGPLVRPNLEEAYLAKLGMEPQKRADRRGMGAQLLDLNA